DASKIRAQLAVFRTALLAHLKLEDEQLYPALVAQAEHLGDAHRALVARTFSNNMKRISEALTTFLERYTSPERPLELEAFRRDCKSIVATLGQRVQA